MVEFVSPSPASGTARAASSRASSTTATPIPTDDVPGLMHVVLGGYHVGDVEFVAAFDVDAAKVGLDLGKAIFAGQNNTIKFANVGELGRARCSARPRSTVSASTTARPSRSRRPSRSTWRRCCATRSADVLVSYLPVGSEEAQRFYAQACLDAGVGVRERDPGVHRQRPGVGARSSPRPASRSSATTSRARSAPPSRTAMLARLFEDRGMAIDRTYQLNFGGNMDFKNMLERTRLESKKISKTQSVTSQIEQGIESDNVHIGPSDHVPWLDDRKWAYIRLEGRNFGDVPLNIELKLEVWDSPNSAGVIIDAVRCCKLALDRGIGGPLAGAVGVLHEVAGGAVPRRRGPRDGRGLHPRTRRMSRGRPRSTAPTGRPSTSCGSSATSPASACSTSGAATGAAAVTLAQQGAVVIAIDTSEARLALGRRARPSEAEVQRRLARRRPRRPRVPPRRLDRPRVQRRRGRRGRRRRPRVPPGAARAQAERGRSCSPTSTRWRCASAPTARSCGSLLRPRPDRRRARRRADPRATRAASARCSPSSAGPASASTPCSSRGPPRRLRACPSTIVWRARKEGA